MGSRARYLFLLGPLRPPGLISILKMRHQASGIWNNSHQSRAGSWKVSALGVKGQGRGGAPLFPRVLSGVPQELHPPSRSPSFSLSPPQVPLLPTEHRSAIRLSGCRSGTFQLGDFRHLNEPLCALVSES